MSRWEPDARGRLMKAAMELYKERGYDDTTVAQIAERAGLTERTYFRHFADKREVLFWGAGFLEKEIVDAVASAPATAPPLDIATLAIVAAAAIMPPDRAAGRARNELVLAHPVLYERELLKMASLVTTLANGLRARGVPDLAAHLAAEAGASVLKVAWSRFLGDTRPRDLLHHVREGFATLASLTSSAPASKRRRQG